MVVGRYSSDPLYVRKLLWLILCFVSMDGIDVAQPEESGAARNIPLIWNIIIKMQGEPYNQRTILVKVVKAKESAGWLDICHHLRSSVVYLRCHYLNIWLLSWIRVRKAEVARYCIRTCRVVEICGTHMNWRLCSVFKHHRDCTDRWESSKLLD